MAMQPESELQINVKRMLLSFVSNCCSFFFLAVLMAYAISSYFYHIWILKDHTYSRSPKEAFPIPRPRRVDDLSYYVELLGFRLERYRVTTRDGFIIDLARIVDPANRATNKKPVLMIPGLMQSSKSYIMCGYKSLAYQLVVAGYDVFLGDNRCGFEPAHVDYGYYDSEMWDWDLQEMSKYDLPCFIEEVRKISGADKVSLVGHSQGTAQIIMLLSKIPKIHPYIDKAVLLAPAAFGGPLLDRKLFIRFMRWLPDELYDIFFGARAFIPIMMTMRKYMLTLPSFGFMSYSMFSALFDSNDYLWDRSLRDYLFIFSPVYSSSKLMKWWLKGKGFKNGQPIMDPSVPWFSETTPPLLMFVAGTDETVEGDLFWEHMQTKEVHMAEKAERVYLPTYGHLDVLWADDVQETIGRPILNFL